MLEMKLTNLQKFCRGLFLVFLAIKLAAVVSGELDIIPTVPGMNFAADDSDGKRLFRDLFLRYLKAERPVKNISNAVTMEVEPILITLLSIEEVDEAVTLNFWMKEFWDDEYLTWDPLDYGNRTEIHVPQKMIWIPDVLIYNNLRLVEHVKEEFLYAIVSHRGRVEYKFPAIFQVSCDLNIKYFPFDRQICHLKFGSWSFHGGALDLVEKSREANLNQYKTNPEWDLERAEVVKTSILYTCCPDPYPDITYWLHLRRKPLFYIITLICPATIITTVSIIGLFSPSYADGEREEKVTMGMTTLLTMSVLLMMVADQMPRTSKVVPVIASVSSVLGLSSLQCPSWVFSVCHMLMVKERRK